MRKSCSIAASLALATVVAGAAAAQKVPDVRLDSGDPPGAADSLFPEIAAVGDSVYVAWSDARHDPFFSHEDIYFNRSLDAGATWLTQDLRLNTGVPQGTVNDDAVEIAATGSAVYVVWLRYGTTDVYSQRSLDGGATWLASEIRVNAIAGQGGYPQIAASGSTVFVTWESGGVVFLNRSLDSGGTWLTADTTVSSGPPGAVVTIPEIAASGSSVYVVWYDTRNGSSDIYLDRSLDAGATWLAQDARLDTGSAPGSSTSAWPRIAVAGTSIDVVYGDFRNGGSGADVYFNRSSDSGATWLAADLRLDTSTPAGSIASQVPWVAVSGSSVYAVWEDAILNPFGGIRFNRSIDGGATWLPADVRIDGGNANLGSSPQVAASGASVFVTWAHGGDVFLDRSLDGGATWLASDLRLDKTDPVGSGSSQWPEVAVTSHDVYVTWFDYRNAGTFSFADVYFNIPFGFQRYGTGKAGCGGFVPSLSGSGWAIDGATVSLDVASGLGGASGVLLLGLTKTSVPLAGGTLLVAFPVTLLPLGLGGAPGACGAGTASYPIALPANPLLVGVAFEFQAMFVDLGVPAGVSMTNGVELWVG